MNRRITDMAILDQLTKEQLASLRRIQASSAIEGYDLISDEEMAAIILEADAPDGSRETIRRLVEKARAEGRPEKEVFREHFGPPSYHRRKS